MIADWPVYSAQACDPEAEQALEHAMDLVRAVRDVRTQMDVPNSRKSKLIIVSQDAGIREIFAQNQTTYAGLANASEVCVQADESGIGSDAVSAVIPDAVIYMPLADLVDLTKEKERLTAC